MMTLANHHYPQAPIDQIYAVYSSIIHCGRERSCVPLNMYSVMERGIPMHKRCTLYAEDYSGD